MSDYHRLSVLSSVYPAWVGEARVFDVLRFELSVIRAIEFDRLDGFVITSKDVPKDFPTDAMARTYSALHNDNLYKQLRGVYFDVKVMIRSISDRGATWRLHATEEQVKHADFFVIVFGESADMCAVVPKNHLFPQDRQKKKGVKQKQYLRTWTSDGPYIQMTIPRQDSRLVHAIPPPLTPYSLPLSRLPDAVREVIQAANLQRKYVNVSRDVTIDWVPKIGNLQNFLSPSIVSSAKRLLQLKIGFEQTQGSVNMSLMLMQPLLADFKLFRRHQSGIQEAFVEHKLGGWKGSPYNVQLWCLRPHTGARRKRTHYFFNPSIQWHFFWADADPKSSLAHLSLVIPRDRVPNNIWLTPQNKTQQWQSAGDLSEFVIDRNAPGWQDKVATIMAQYPSCNPPPNHDLLMYLLDTIEEIDEEEVEPDDDDEGGPLKGMTEEQIASGRYRNRVLSPLFYHLNDLCAREGRGIFLYLGARHPFGNFFFIKHQWTDAQRFDFWMTGELPITAESPNLSSKQLGVWIFSSPIVRQNAGAAAKTTMPWTLYHRRQNLLLLRELRSDLSHTRQNFYFIPSVFLSEDHADWRQLGLRQRPSDGKDGNLDIPLDRPFGLQPQPFWKINNIQLLDRLYDVLDPYIPEVAFNWFGFKGPLRSVMCGQFGEGLLEMSRELVKYG